MITIYPCDCFATGICWIVRHPILEVPVSFETEVEARVFLEGLEKDRSTQEEV
jgi:hypothetical protein